ncbi:MAG: HlyD family efflux transporter periplasmic adaptor subunit [Xanthomonadaceae bacterium]|nr:HlyD family efflux transporter periplasmic adaptor subunit [Xanthomonadaceae bacterium]
MAKTLHGIGFIACAALLLVGCREDPPQALGTLEYDRISLPAPVAERIVKIAVKEGDRVEAGATLLVLETTRTDAQTRASEAEAQRQRDALAELEAGTRAEQIAQAEAQVAAADAQARDAQAYETRLRPLGARKLVAAADVDRAVAAARSAEARLRQAREALNEARRGARSERVAQARSAVRAAEAQAEAQTATLRKLEIVAPRAGRIDSLPYRLGDQAPIGAPLALMLVGDAPYARVYVPEPLRANVAPGTAARVRIDGRETVYRGRVRSIRSDPSFTPYYALAGKDAARLSYVAEIVLDDADELPAGLPVRVDFEAAPPR